MRPPLPISVLKNLRCGHCRKFVTCGPVFVTPDSSILCGRCVRFAKKSYRNFPFEALASIYRYPCFYWPKHCNKQLAWNEALEHERKCLFQSSCNVFCSRPGTFFKSDRKFVQNPEFNLEHVPDELLDSLKCVACESYISHKPVFLVVDGKSICHRCSHSNGVPKGAIRNLAYETIASTIIFPCIYRYRGCTIRQKFGREMWGHESQCPYGQVAQRLSKKPSKGVKEGKERGVIETHSGHIWGTITPHSALFAPPKTKNNDGQIVTQELTEVMKKKQDDKGFDDSQSMDSVMSRASTFDSSMGDNLSRTTGDNTSRDNISRSTVDNISRDNISRSSSTVPGYDPRYYNNAPPMEDYRASQQGYPGPSNFKIPRPYEEATQYSPYPEEVHPVPTPTGYNKISFNGYYQENLTRYARPSQLDQFPPLFHFPPVYQDGNSPLNHSNSFNFTPTHSQINQSIVFSER
ncbi:unnamed protein product [Tenebrio molitor]|nr:unnamed protein product [Tenebrio molitor]